MVEVKAGGTLDLLQPRLATICGSWAVFGWISSLQSNHACPPLFWRSV